MRASDLLRDVPPESAHDWDDDLEAPHDRILVALDDDPTGTQSVRDLPVLTSWDDADLDWALAQDAPAIYVVRAPNAPSRPRAARGSGSPWSPAATAPCGDIIRWRPTPWPPC